MRRLSSFALVLLLVLGAVRLAIAQELPTASERLNARLATLHSIRADFSQTTIDASQRTLQETFGRLWVGTPSRFRIETEEPFVQTLVSDGVSFWSYDGDLAQVIIRPLETDLRQVPILLLSGDSERVTAQYTVTSFDDANATSFVLSPRSANSLFETLTVEFIDELPTAITIADSLGQRTRVALRAVDINPDTDPGVFRFSTPAGVDVIDDRPAD